MGDALSSDPSPSRRTPLSLRQIAERFIQLYWQQAAPYAATSVISNEPAVLVQNNGAQAAIVNLVKAFRERTGAATAQQGMRDAAYPALLWFQAWLQLRF